MSRPGATWALPACPHISMPCPAVGRLWHEGQAKRAQSPARPVGLAWALVCAPTLPPQGVLRPLRPSGHARAPHPFPAVGRDSVAASAH